MGAKSTAWTEFKGEVQLWIEDRCVPKFREFSPLMWAPVQGTPDLVTARCRGGVVVNVAQKRFVPGIIIEQRPYILCTPESSVVLYNHTYTAPLALVNNAGLQQLTLAPDHERFIGYKQVPARALRGDPASPFLERAFTTYNDPLVEKPSSYGFPLLLCRLLPARQ